MRRMRLPTLTVALTLTLAVLPRAAKAEAESESGADEKFQLEALRVPVGFARAEVLERHDEHDPHWGAISLRQYSLQLPSHIWWRIVEIKLGPKAPRTLKHYLEHWHQNHGCSGMLVDGVPALRRGDEKLPQITYSGACEAPEEFIVRVVIVGDLVYELHADVELHFSGTPVEAHASPTKRPASPKSALRDSLTELLGQVEVRSR
jgi:hypothetical protein